MQYYSTVVLSMEKDKTIKGTVGDQSSISFLSKRQFCCQVMLDSGRFKVRLIFLENASDEVAVKVLNDHISEAQGTILA